MLNPKTNQRELAYVVKIKEVRDIEGVNNQVAVVNGWTVFVTRDEFKAGDLAVYFEIDSKVPELECFEFLRKYDFRVKTQRFVKGKVLSQGLVIKPEDLGLKNVKEGDFLTERLNVIYYNPEDNKRKSNISGKYMSMRARHPKLAKTKLFKWLWKSDWGKKVLFFFLGRKKDKPNDWPSWVVKTDEERCQNCFESMKKLNLEWIVTEKIDGSSSTYTMKQDKPKKRKMLVCSRNVVFNAPEKEDKNFYKDTDGNIYLEMAAKYDMEKVLSELLDRLPSLEYITFQGEIYGGTIQKRNYGPEHRLAIFNVIFKQSGKAPERLNPIDMKRLINNLNETSGFNLECVPVMKDTLDLPQTCEELLALAGGKSWIDGEMREGIVLRSGDGVHSFKAVDNEFLLKYHQ